MKQLPSIHFLSILFILLSISISGIAENSSHRQVQVKKRNQELIHPGKIWPDNKGNHINAHGGGILKYNNKYYWFGEHKSKNTSIALVGVNCYSSTDLCNWIFEGVSLPVSKNINSPITKGCIIERPKVIYNPKTKKFVMWFHLELKDKGYVASQAAVAISDNPTGPYVLIHNGRVNPQRYPSNFTQEQCDYKFDESKYTTWWTPEWYKAIGDGLYLKRDLFNGQMARDMTLFVDDDDKAYHIYSSEENLTLHIAELSDDYTTHSGKYIRIFPGGHNEAPAIFKKDGVYWMITSGCTGWAPNKARMFSSPSIWGPWKQHTNPCIGKKSETTFGGQSTFILKIEGSKKDKYVFMADIWRPNNPIDARYIWLPIEFMTNGTPVVKWVDKFNPSL